MTAETETPAQAARKPRRVRPGAVGARWLRPLVLPLGLGRLEITDAAGQAEAYDVGAHLDAENRVVGFRLVTDDDEGHDLFPGPAGWACSCPRFGHDGGEGVGGCEHAAGLRAALAAIGQLPPAPPPAPPPATAGAAGGDDRYPAPGRGRPC
jgi:hypothetical protein